MTMRVNIPALPPFQMQSILQVLLTLAASLLTLRFGVGLAAWRAANNLEKPSYTVLKRLPMSPPSRGNIEVRKYDQYLIAETTVEESSMRRAGGAGFGKVSYCGKYNISLLHIPIIWLQIVSCAKVCWLHIWQKWATNKRRWEWEDGNDSTSPISRRCRRENGHDVSR